VITNGYDPEHLRDVRPFHFDHFAIVYTGIFYPPERVITPILLALQQLVTRASGEWFFHYYGADDAVVREDARRLGVSHRVTVHGRVARAEALSAVKGANIAVVIASTSNDPSREIYGWIPAKLFEAIGLGTPVLLIAPPGSDVESIAEPTGLVRRVAGNDVAGIVSFIEETMSGSVVKPRHVEALTWNRIGTELHHVLSQTVRRFPADDCQMMNDSPHEPVSGR